jgi:hypothetical protein
MSYRSHSHVIAYMGPDLGSHTRSWPCQFLLILSHRVLTQWRRTETKALLSQKATRTQVIWL